MIELFKYNAPDFEAAEKLIEQGADLNLTGVSDEENILSEILDGYRVTHSLDSTYTEDDNLRIGANVCDIIRFFLAHGFDVTKDEGCYGAQCLWALAFSTYDRYMIEATKILLDAGARNRTISLSSSDMDETPWSAICDEGSSQEVCEGNNGIANLYEAVNQIYQAVEDGRPYNGIDSYEIAMGKRISKVMAEGNGRDGMMRTLYFIYEGGALIVSRYGELWTDRILPEGELTDVSSEFENIIGRKIRNFAYDHKPFDEKTSSNRRPIVSIEMEDGHQVEFYGYFIEGKDSYLVNYDVV
jgi:hypothetical protein